LSRTDKDAPWWYQAPHWEPRHVRCEHATRAWYGASTYGPARTCDLPDRPDYARDAPRAGIGGIRSGGCYWAPHWPFRCTCDHCRPPHHGIGERAAVRAYRRRIMAEHRATGTTDAELATVRRGPRWCDW
jgi:hypothetical protein